METVVVQVNNHRAFSLLENLEALDVIKVLRDIPFSRSEKVMPALNGSTDRAMRLSEIQSITKNIHIDLTNYKFNRDEANNYDS